MVLLQYPAAWAEEEQKTEKLRKFLKIPKSMPVVFCVAANNIEQVVANACLCDCDYCEGETAMILYMVKDAIQIDRITWDRYMTGQTSTFPSDSLLHIRYPELTYYIMTTPPTGRFVMDYKLQNLNSFSESATLDEQVYFAMLAESCEMKKIAEEYYIDDIKKLSDYYRSSINGASPTDINIMIMHFAKWSYETNLLIPIYALGFRHLNEHCEYEKIPLQEQEDISYSTPEIEERQYLAELLILFHKKKFAEVSDEMARDFLNRIQRMAMETFFWYDFLGIPTKKKTFTEKAPDFIKVLTETCEMY